MAGYIGNIPVPQATQTRESFTATASQTSFATSGYTPGFLDVYLNGVHLETSDYTATNGSDVVLASGATSGDILTVVAYSTFEAATQDQLYYSGTTKLQTTSTGVDVTGTVTADGLTVDGTATLSSNTGNILTLNRPDGAGSPNILFQSNGVQSARLLTDATNNIIFERGTTDALKIDGATGDISFYEDTGTTAKFFWDASAERLGIGTSSPTHALTVEYNETTTAQFQNTNTSGTAIDSAKVTISSTSRDSSLSITANSSRASFIDFGDEVSVTRGRILYDHPTDSLIISTSAAERMRIDSSGNLLVGTTTIRPDSGTGNAGIQLDPNGVLRAGRAGDCMVLNRQSTDGAIVYFRKDGVDVGSIGTEGNDLAIGNDDAGIQFVNGNEHFRPFNMTSNASTDALMNIGSSTKRFKDLYLSGGVYLGGTGSANYLDDYEEGTWSPTLSQGSASYASTPRYIKVGNLVTVWAYLDSFTNRTSTDAIQITNLPFTCAEDAVGSVMTRYVPYTSVNCYSTDNGTNMYFIVNQGSSSNWTNLDYDHLDSASAVIKFTITYEAT